MSPTSGAIPGYYPVSDDGKDKGAKKSRRKKKSSSKDEPAAAGPSSSVASPPTAQPGHRPAPSIQHPSQLAPATSYPIRSAQPSAQTGPGQTGQSLSQPGQATMSAKPTNTPGPAGGPPSSRSLPAPSNSNEGVLAGKSGANLSKGMSSIFGDGPQEIVRLKGQPRRPDSNFENRIWLVSNYFQLTHKSNLKLWHYAIAVNPEVKGLKLTQIIKTALDSGPYSSLKPSIVTDFSAIMLSVKEVPQECQSFKISYKSELETQASDNAREYEIYLDPIGTVDLSNPGLYLQHMERSSSGLPIEQALDIILGHHRKLSDDVAIINKRKAFTIKQNPKGYDGSGLGDRSPPLIALRGYFSSVRMSQSSLLVNINVSHGAFYKAGLPLGYLIPWLGGSVDRSKVPGLLRGLRVESSHIRRFWSIWGFPRNGDGKGYMLHPPRFHFPDAIEHTPQQVRIFYEEKPKESSKDRAPTLSEKEKELAKEGKLKPHGEQCGCRGRWLTIAQYFEQVRGQPIPLQHLQLPLVNAGSNRRPTYLPCHLCNVRSGQLSKLKLDKEQTKAMIKFAVRAPSANAGSIVSKGFTTLGLNTENQELASFGISVDKTMVRLKGRVLERPSLVYGKEKKPQINRSIWSLQDLRFHTPIERLNSWACTRIIQDINREGSIRKHPCKGLLTNFQEHLKKKGIIAELNDNHGDLFLPGNDYRRLDEWFRESRDVFGVEFMLVLLPDRPTSELYNSIKRYGDVQYGIHTVCVKAKMFGTLPYDDNVALKINLKLGGINHILGEGFYGPIFKDKTMVVGIDVTHPPPGEENTPSVAAVVASHDEHLSQWPADLRINKSRQEMVMMLREMLMTRLELYKKMNEDSLPKNILIYRDGVGEGQYKIVLDEELPRLRDACRKLYGREYIEGTFPRISLIVVGKRHHTRFYRTTDKYKLIEGSGGNPSSGTVVDSNTITQSRNWDFFLQSHTAITGTARPAHYFVLVDEIFRQTTPQDPVRTLENLTYNLCYLYGKATTSVSIPPPVYYADKACDRGRRYLSRVFDQGQRRGGAAGDDDVKVHEGLVDTMFYI